MLTVESQLERLRQWAAGATEGVLSLYADVNPAKPENANGAWFKRIDQTLKHLPEIRDRHGKRDQPLYDQVYALLEAERPHARTLALFAYRDGHGHLHTERLDLQVELPVVDLRQGRVEARYGAPYLTPLWLAVDEYERTGILLLEGARWRFFEVFLDEIREDEELLTGISRDEWQQLQAFSERITATWRARSATPGGRCDKLSLQERTAARVDAWLHAFYHRLAHLLEQTVERLRIGRLVLIGEHWQTGHFESYLSRRLQQQVVSRLPLWPEAHREAIGQIWRRVEPVLFEVERQQELALLNQVQEQPGLWGIDPVLDALQLGRVRRWILPWSLDITVWRCPEDGFVAAMPEIAQVVCAQPEAVALREHVLELAASYGAELEFVRGAAAERLLKEMGGMAALLRW
ncbi:MAG: VLRF1 family aeRF1-type release factor [Gloeomargarita sp. SKYG116]|nr:VLRF1 family aeRF1-type release factor [Gloeomargarita sp. SKYG116]MDW8401600.1 VLRF1 family aeRF1-type release factor [Gloeomargarita sp. SKYGB_i_bin116]